jgi:hypothetical protein
MFGGLLVGALGGIRTPDPQIRSYVLRVYPSPWPSRKMAVFAGYSPNFKGIFIDTERL